MSLKQNWNKTPLLPHKSILKLLVVVWAIIVVWMMVVGVNPIVIAIVPAVVIAFVYLIARLLP